jgi:hypothetical protein
MSVLFTEEGARTGTTIQRPIQSPTGGANEPARDRYAEAWQLERLHINAPFLFIYSRSYEIRHHRSDPGSAETMYSISWERGMSAGQETADTDGDAVALVALRD